MIVTSTVSKSKYPFTEASSLKLYSGHCVNPGVIFNANLYPAVSSKPGYAYIAAVSDAYLKYGVGCLVIKDSICGDIDLEVRFDLSDTGLAGVLLGSAVQYGRYCGSVVAATDLAPLLLLARSFDTDSFVLTSSAYYPVIVDSVRDLTEPTLQDTTAEHILKFKFKQVEAGKYGLGELGNIVRPDNHKSKTQSTTPIRKIMFVGDNGSTVVSPDTQGCLNILPKSGSKVRVMADRHKNALEVGRCDDLSIQ